ncbi:MAG: NAD(P)/FAD-dependent oxidoreductase [Gammaproteobacteria bacterium]
MNADAGYRPTPTDLRVIIIGAGFGGLCMAIKLKQAGIDDFVLLEKNGDVGGTWWANTYPGCACDVQSLLYSFSFEQNPDWSHMFGRQPEILGYLRHCVEKYRLAPHIRLSSEVTHAAYQDAEQHWQVQTADGVRYRTRILVAATGPLSRPAIPDLPGLDRFAGEVFHSAQWAHDYSLQGKQVAVIGTGASAIQFVPAIAPRVANLYLFQRTPPWVLPRPDRKVSRLERWLFRRWPLTQRIARYLMYWRLESRAVVFTVWPRLGGLLAAFGRWNIRRQVRDPLFQEKLTPDYPAGCKRLLLSDDYYPALNRGNVHLVTDPVRECTATGVVTADGDEFTVDAIILGTGFQATAPFPKRMITGSHGVDITERWRAGMEAYKGISVSGFPNFFMLAGPNTGLGHNSVVFMLEAQVGYIMQAMSAMERQSIDGLEVRPEIEAAFNRQLQRRLARTVWANGCRSWYLDANGRNVTLWPGFTVEYWFRTRRFRFKDYRVAAKHSPGPGPDH